MEKTLLLNATYEPLRVITWQDAIVLAFQNKADVLESYDRLIRSTRLAIPVPAVVRVRRYVPFQRSCRHVKFSRQNVFTRDRYTCQYCGNKFRMTDLTFDHVVPVCQGGFTSFENIVTACQPCNYKKAGRTPEEAGMKLANGGHHPRWPLAITLMLAVQRDTPTQWQNYLFGAQGNMVMPGLA